jgi:hypothetical protein
VRDRVTKKYLGIICISSSMMNLSERNKEVFGGEVKIDIKKYEDLYIQKLKREQRLEAIKNGELPNTENSKESIKNKSRFDEWLKKQETPIIDKNKFKQWLQQQQSYIESCNAKKHFKKAFAVNGRSLNMANGQTIMCTQPFGRIFNGGKLLALLCSSKQVANDWKEKYGDVLVTVETTSLYGEKDSTQYDGLRPYWINLGKTSGNTPIKPTNEL